MTILSESTQWADHTAGIIVALLALIAVTIGVAMFASYLVPEAVAAPIAGLLFIVGLYYVYDDAEAGPDVHVKAVIADWNEVYANNYEVISREGEIYTLKEARP